MYFLPQLQIQSYLKKNRSAMNTESHSLLELFTNYTEHTQKMILVLIQEGFQEMGENCGKDYFQQWRLITLKLNTANKLSALNDKNHRLLILKFIREEAASYYNSSYFNHAKIDIEYISWLQKIGPYEFSQTITIVNKLKLIEKHYKAKMETNIIIENHIDYEIRKIMALCASKKRNLNNNLNKFRQIAQFEDRQELVKQLGKMLRKSWSGQKQNSNTLIQQPLIQLIPQNNIQQGRPTQEEGLNNIFFEFNGESEDLFF